MVMVLLRMIPMVLMLLPIAGGGGGGHLALKRALRFLIVWKRL